MNVIEFKSLNQTLNRLKISPSECSHQALYPTVSAVQSSTITLEKCFVKSCFDIVVLILRRKNTESV